MKSYTFSRHHILYFLILSAIIIEGCRTFNHNEKISAGVDSKTATSNVDRNVAGFNFFDDYYQSKVQKVFDNRCVACHSCYNAPCQLQFSSYEGIMRGANKNNVHDFLLVDRRPSRLGIDAHSPQEWQSSDFEFYPVVDIQNPKESLIWNMIHLGKEARALTNTEYLPKVEDSKFCPKQSEFSNYKSANLHGMPYGLPALSDIEMKTLEDWMKKGFPGPSDSAAKEMKRPSVDLSPYEGFLNQKDMKHRLVARFIYEHLFLAHFFFLEDGRREFFRLIRAKKSKDPNQEIREIATRVPSDSPEGDFEYRFIKVTQTITQKTHITYKMDSSRLARWQNVFFGTDWEGPSAMPSYEKFEALNPFKTFANIPAKARYQFLLDDNYFFIKNFILGPVCRGQLAVDSIDDHFWVFFLDPDKDPMLNERPNFLKDNADVLASSGAYGSKAGIFYGETVNDFRLRRAKLYSELQKEKGFNFNNSLIWTGAGERKNINTPLLTIMRHFDSASVSKGGAGGIPKTIWVVDFHQLEELFYNLVTGYDVFAGRFHHLRARIHMDGSRVNGQDLFLAFMPPSQRKVLREYWHQKAPMEWWQKAGRITNRVSYEKFPWSDVNSTILNSLDVKAIEKNVKSDSDHSIHLAQQVQTKIVSNWMSMIYSAKGKAIEAELDCCSGKVGGLQTSDSLSKIDLELRKISRVESVQVGRLPDVTYIRIKRIFGSDITYTLVVNKEHLNVDHIFNEESRRAYTEDYLTVHKGFVGSYPNLFLEIPEYELQNFTTLITSILNDKNMSSDGWKQFYSSKWVISRFNPNFWNTYDFFNASYLKMENENAGVIDISRYQ